MVKKRSYLIIANAHAYMRMRIRSVRTYVRIPPYIYIYTARLIIEHPREWLASLADKLDLVHIASTLIDANKACS